MVMLAAVALALILGTMQTPLVKYLRPIGDRIASDVCSALSIGDNSASSAFCDDQRHREPCSAAVSDLDGGSRCRSGDGNNRCLYAGV